MQSTVFGVSGFFPFKFIIGVSAGNGIVGIAMGVIRYLIILGYGTSTDRSNIIRGSVWFFGLATLTMLAAVLMVPVMVKHPYYKVHFYKSGELDKEEYQECLEQYEFVSETHLITEEELQAMETGNKRTAYEYFKILMVKLYDLNFMIFLNFLITFTVFPGLCMHLSLFKLAPAWYFNTVVFIFNVFDTIGRYLPNYTKMSLHTLKLCIVIKVFLFILFGIFFVLDKYHYIGVTISSLITIVLMTGLGLTNGYLASKCFYYAPQQVDNELKGRAASSISFFLVTGIFTGTLFANFITQQLI
eukprot:CAMPEP_0170514870 /NCGR_PEP_ID=MMETSP0209-20121228/1395_1 /TAXON_ID=665100 ORGANISM="Litonotus pictus, Strain P1" /NCGR_SAMPLE_ID=MMETSP0209 /ASSEMBLY_ACC=CAM_ASM_000301 /LENGTH=300 /DNA_ID=CAMNT_0010799125 /DNA_START=413 /DNA_END=1315 /DNA_ORIENTATION=-